MDMIEIPDTFFAGFITGIVCMAILYFIDFILFLKR
jgi:hypothetical protein